MWLVYYRAIGETKIFTNLIPESPINDTIRQILDNFIDETDVPSKTKIQISKSSSGKFFVSLVNHNNLYLPRSVSEPMFLIS